MNAQTPPLTLTSHIHPTHSLLFLFLVFFFPSVSSLCPRPVRADEASLQRLCGHCGELAADRCQRYTACPSAAQPSLSPAANGPEHRRLPPPWVHHGCSSGALPFRELRRSTTTSSVALHLAAATQPDHGVPSAAAVTASAPTASNRWALHGCRSLQG